MPPLPPLPATIAQDPQNGGKQNAVKGVCPEGYTHVFGPLCIEKVTLSKFKSALPELPKINMDNISCDSVLAAMNSVLDSVDDALKMPGMLIDLAKTIIERPFVPILGMVSSVFKMVDEIEQAITDILSGPLGAIGNIKNALERFLACPFLSDLPIAKEAAAILDKIDGNLLFSDELNSFKSSLRGSVTKAINDIKNEPLGALDKLQSSLDQMLEESGVNDLLKKARDLENCIRSACNLGEAIVDALPESAESVVEAIGGVIDETTGKISVAIAKPINASQQYAQQLGQSIAVMWPATTP